MNCTHCGRPSEPGSKFCVHCGKPLAPEGKFCGQCGAETDPASRFCAKCGKPLVPGPTPTDGGTRPSPSRTEPPPAAAPAPKQASPATGKKGELDQICAMYAQGEKEQARDRLLDYVKRKAKDPLAWTILGNYQRELGQDTLAEQAYRMAVKLDRKAHNAYVGLGVLERKKGEYGKALDCYIQAVKANPRSAQAFTSAVVVALKLGQDAQALEFAEKAWELDKEDPTVAANLSVAYHYVGRLADRDRMYEQARRLGYPSMETLDKIFRGELTMRD